MIVDANVLVSAAIGTSLPLLSTLARDGHDLIVPVEQFREAELNGSRVAEARNLDRARLLHTVLDLVQMIDRGFYAAFEQAARARLDRAPKAQKDWPLLALAFATGDAVWSNDRDLFGTGIVTWTTGNISFLPPAAALRSE